MKALITGASSGIGRDMANILSEKGFDLILVARRKDRLEQVQRTLKSSTKIICADLSVESACMDLYERVKDENIDILINNAGLGIFGAFDTTDLQKELRMIDTNIRAVHILTKFFLKDFKAKNAGYILNVASAAAFQPGPLLSSYYASKAYVLRLTEAISEELRRSGSAVHICALCPGPVHTEFDEVADVKFSVKGLESRYVAEYAIQKMFEKKMVIVPGTLMKFTRFFGRFLPEKQMLRISYHMQKRKAGKK